MKKILYITSSIAFCLLLALSSGCKPEPQEAFGSIYGMVSVAGTAEPMRGTGVELYYLNKQGTAGALLLRTTTANDGSYSFEDVKVGEYLLRVEVPGYKRTEYKVVVESGRSARADMQVRPKGEADDDEGEESDDVYILKVVGLMVQKRDLGTGTYSWSTADAMCKGSTLAGYTDWRLPTKEELMILYNNKTLIGGFQNDWYWSSTRSSSNSNPYWCVNFTNGELDYWSGSRRIRAVRTINTSEDTTSNSFVEMEGLMIQTKDLEPDTWRNASNIAKASRLGGYSDWRLPTEEELEFLYKRRTLIGGFTLNAEDGAYYWSSSLREVEESFTTEDGKVVPAGYYPILFDFSDGKSYFTWGEEVVCRVRAVRISDASKRAGTQAKHTSDFSAIRPSKH